jgi:hypothetical protein
MSSLQVMHIFYLAFTSCTQCFKAGIVLHKSTIRTLYSVHYMQHCKLSPESIAKLLCRQTVVFSGTSQSKGNIFLSKLKKAIQY